MLHMGQGRLDEAVADLQTALEIALDAGNLRFETNVHRYMGDLAQLQGCLDEALQQFERALVLAREASYRSGEGQVLACLWRLHTVLGRMAEARREPSDSEFILREVQDPLNLALLLCHFGEYERVAGDLNAAGQHLSRLFPWRKGWRRAPTPSSAGR